MKLIRRPFRLFNSSEIFLLNLFTVLSNKKPIVIRGINLSQKLSWEKYCHQLNYHYYCKLHLVQKKRRSDFQGIDQDSSIRDIWAPLLLQMHQMYSYKLSSSLPLKEIQRPLRNSYTSDTWENTYVETNRKGWDITLAKIPTPDTVSYKWKGTPNSTQETDPQNT